MVTKEMYLKGVRCKGMCIFCEDIDNCYQYTKSNNEGNIEIRVFNYKTNKVAYKILSNSEADLLLNNIELKWKE